MSNYTRQHPGHPSNRDDDECASHPNPADQPKDPPEKPDGACEKICPLEPPTLEEPKECPPPPCCCPTGPPSTSNCLDKLIEAQTMEIAEAEDAKKFKADLEALLAKAKAAKLEYTVDKHKKLVDEWKKQDAEIADLIRKLVCAVPCWWCIIECHICPLLYWVRYRKQKLYGDGTLYSEVRTLHDLRYWHERNQDAKQRTFDRIKSVLVVWEKPSQTIDKALVDNAKLIADTGKFLAPDAAKLVYDVFLRLVPMHLAIAPPKGSGITTAIGKEYTDFCVCDEGKPDDCCGPDVGEPSVRQRLIGPQPYLVNPDDYFAIICCLVEQRYLPAKNALAGAKSAYQRVDAEITKYTAEIDERIKSLDKDAKAAIPSVIDCGKYEKDNDSEPPARAAR